MKQRTFNLSVAHFFLFLLLFQSPVTAQDKYAKFLLKSDALYQQGDYVKSLKTLKKYQKKTVQKQGPNHPYLFKYHFRNAKINLAQGNLSTFDAEMELAVALSANSNGENSLLHAKNLLDAAEVYAHYGNYNIANQYIDKSSKTLELADALDDNLKAKIDLTTAKILSGQGYSSKAQSFINEIEEYFKGRAVQKESYVDKSTGKIKTRKLSDLEAKERMEDYASLLTLKGIALSKQGDISKADMEFLLGSRWIGKKLGTASTSYIYHNLTWAQMLEKNGIIDFSQNNDTKEIRYEKTLSYAKKSHTESHYLVLEIYESMMKNYLRLDESSKYRQIKSDYQSTIKKYFKKQSIHYINLKTIDFESRLDKGKTDNLQAEVNAITSNSTSIPNYHPKRIELLDLLVNISLKEKDYKNTENYFNQLLEVKKELYGEKSPAYHLSKIKLANFYMDYTDKFDEAGKIYLDSYTNYLQKELKTQHADIINILTHLSIYYDANDQYDLAASTINQAADAAWSKYDNQDKAFAIQLNKLALLQLKLGEYEEAKKNIDQSVSILEKERKDKQDVILYIQSLETKAQYLTVIGLYDEAEDVINSSSRLLRRAENIYGYDEIASTVNLSELYMHLGKYSQTEPILLKVIHEYELLYGKNSRNLILPLCHLGNLELLKGNYSAAEQTIKRAYQIATDIYGDNSSKIAIPSILMSDLNTVLGDYDQAENFLNKAIKIQTERFGNEHIELAKSYSKLGLIKLYQGNTDDNVIVIMESSRNIIASKVGGTTPAYAESLKNLSSVYIARKDYEKALISLQSAERIYKARVTSKKNVHVASIYAIMGDLYYYQKMYDKSEEFYNLSSTLYRKMFSDQHPEYVKIISKLSRVAYMKGDLKGARKKIDEALFNYNGFIKDYFPALSEREKAKFWNTIKPDFEFFNTLALKTSEDNPKTLGAMFNNALTTKALLLSSSIKIRQTILSSTDEELKLLYKDWLAKKELLTTTLSLSDEQLQEENINPQSLQNELETIEKELSQKSDLFSSGIEQANITWDKVRNALKEDEVAVEMVRFRYFDHVFTDSVVYAALYVKKESGRDKPKVILLKNGKDLEGRYFNFYRNAIIYKMDDPHSYSSYWKPIHDKIGALSTVYLSGDGIYNQINLETLKTSETKYIIDNSNIILVSNTKDIFLNKTKTKRVAKNNSALMFGNPQFYMSANASGKVAQLPGTEKEIEYLKNLLKEKGWVTDYYLNDDASEDRLKSSSSPKIFHVATHGFFTSAETIKTDEIEINQSKAFENPLLRTGLLLTGAGDILDKTKYNYNTESGILTAYEAMNLNLDQTDLVVLSACETGLGDITAGEGVYGLQRAFMVAGAKTLIMSMFKVDDEATQKLMVKFYTKWLETGQMRQSFIDAKKEVRVEYKDPIYWGAFIMIGLE